MARVPCKQCATPFKVVADRKLFCSRACWQGWWDTHRIRRPMPCARCGEVFTPPRSSNRTVKYCSLHCSGLANGVSPVTHAAKARCQPRPTHCKKECGVLLVPRETIPEARFRNHDYICNACFTAREAQRRRRNKDEVFEAYGGKCRCCGE